MNIPQLVYFLSAAQHGSFSAAAKSLHLAQPSLSEQIRRLEGELGVPLFVRVGRGVTLTEAGKTLVPHAQSVLASVEAAREAVAGVRDVRAGVATFGTFSTAVYYLLADLAEDFAERYPGVRVRLTGLNSAAVAEDVRSGRLEAGLVVLPVDDEGLHVRPVMRDEVLYLSAHEHRLRRPIRITDLAERPIVLSDASHVNSDPSRRLFTERAQAAGVTIQPLIEVEHLSTALELAARGIVDTIAPSTVARSRRFPAGLKGMRFADRIYDTFAFITRRGGVVSPATQALMSLAEARLGDLQREIDEREP